MKMHTINTITIKISQFFGIIVYIYFISQYEHYHIFWNLYWMFSFEVIELINYFLSKIGTLFLLLPLIITLISIFIPKNSSWGIISAIFGIYSSLVIILSGYLNNGSLDVYNMKPFILARILTLEEKIQIFQSIINDYLLDYAPSNNISHFLVKISKLEQHKEILIKLKGRLAVEDYTIELINYAIQANSEGSLVWYNYGGLIALGLGIMTLYLWIRFW
jgi:hypothetical protein